MQPLTLHIDVLSPAEEDADALNRTLREAGMAARCRWHASADALLQALDTEGHLIVVRDGTPSNQPEALINSVRQRGCEQSVVILSDDASEEHIVACQKLGAADLITLTHNTRITATVKREIRLIQMQRQIDASKNNAANVQKQFTTLLDNVPDAIAHVQEGIIVEVNKAWLERFGYADEDDCTAMPFMDAIAPHSQGAVKGALVAISKDKWSGEALQIDANRHDGQTLALTLSMQGAVYDDEPAVRIAIKPEEKEDKRTSSLMRDAMNKDQSTFLYHRRHFSKLVQKRISKPLESGQRMMAWIRIDSFKDIRQQLGVILSEEVISDFAEVLRQKIEKTDLAGRFEGTAFTVLLERGNEHDAEVWARNFSEFVAQRVFEAGNRTVSLTCTIGIALHTKMVKDASSLIELSEHVYREAKGEAKGDGNTGQIALEQPNDEDTRIRRHDAMWSKRLTEALRDNRFRLLQQPVAALDGESTAIADLLIRFVDEQGDVVAPSEFLPAARRSNMMQALDRWVINASLALCKERKPTLVFIRLSEQSIVDKSFYAWLKSMISKNAENPATLCFQIPEETALKYLKSVAQTANFVKQLGCKFALEHCGTAPQSSKLLQSLALDFVKIDGSLITSLSSDPDSHQTTSELVAVAKSRGIETIAEKVQDANTMAALWQLGISYMQGHYVQEPEVVLQETA
ncbi:MAG: EAL domain-containing protein [Pseudomonadota bacterium]